MGQRKPGVSARVDKLRNRLEHWRRTRRKGTRIPEALWAVAVDLARVHGVNPIARSLRLDYYSLKQRVVAAQAVASGGGDAGPAFVELDVGGTTAGEQCLIELCDGEGVRMTVTIRGSSPRGVDLEGVLAAFLGRRR
jgi:hypothetical protein